MAARWENRIHTVCKGHGATAFSLTMWREYELLPTSIYITEFAEYSKYLRMGAKVANYKTIIENDGVRLNGYPKGDSSEKKIVYVPGLFDTLQTVDTCEIPPPLYFRIQLQILQALNDVQGFRIVYKCLPGNSHQYHYPVPQFINDHFKNVEVSFRPLGEELADAEYCLLDTASSAMWDALEARVKCRSLIWGKLILRPSAYSFYHDYFVPYTSELDVYEKVLGIINNKAFYTISEEDAASMKRSQVEIKDLFLQAMV